ELMIKSGAVSVAAKPTQKQEAPAVQEKIPAEPIQKRAEPERNDEEFIPPPEEPPMHESHEQAATNTVATDSDFEGWAQVLNELGEINKPIWGILIGSTAYIRNDFVLIKSENPTFASFIKTGTNARDVKEAIFRVTGKKYRLGIYNPTSAAAGTTAAKPKDPLENLVSKARDLGVNITIE
ncbi:MAG: hypothetical protein NC110_04680, partial [Ruminococcus sp.]|nr:hypothetical protein [Ruminococcus sp.]